MVGRVVADRFVTMAQFADAAGEKTHDGVRRSIGQFVDDICGTPPRLRWPLAFPWPGPKRDFKIEPVARVGMGIELFKASESMSDSTIASDLAEAGNRLAQTGLE
jgi:hypothetical protein